MSQSLTSLLSDANKSAASLMTNPNESTTALIPKVGRLTPHMLESSSESYLPLQKTTAQSGLSADVRSNATASASNNAATNANTRAKPSPANKDYESAYGQLATSLGFGGGVPQLPPKKKRSDKGKGKSDKDKKGKTTNISASASSSGTQSTGVDGSGTQA